MSLSKCSLQSNDEVAYLSFNKKKSNKTGSVNKNVYIKDVMPNYKGPDLYFDFDRDGFLVGIEILFD